MAADGKLHEGEVYLQRLCNVQEEQEEIVRRIFRPYMPEQHTAFFENLAYLFVGSLDEEGFPWASIVVGKPGFAFCPSPTILEVNTRLHSNDPLRKNLKLNAPLGVVGVEFSTRRRNRMNGKVASLEISSGGVVKFQVKVDLSFGNCPKYIQARAYQLNTEQLLQAEQANAVITTSYLTEEQRDIILRSDTFFVASSYLPNNDPASGVDVSHRGGKPSFITLHNTTLQWPDYVGNYLFNTLGNLYKNPKCGLLFIDFETGHTLQLCGEAIILFDEKSMPGAQRAVQFSLKQAILTKKALPMTWTFLSESPYCPEPNLVAGINPKTGVRGFRMKCVEIINECADVKTFVLQAGIAVTNNQIPGQYASFVIENKGEVFTRTWTISSAPASVNDYEITITVKRKPNGIISTWLHEHFRIGHSILLTGIEGNFTLDSIRKTNNKILFIAAGAGITPFMSIIRGLMISPAHSQISLSDLDIVLLISAKKFNELIFLPEFLQLEREYPKNFRLVLTTTQQQWPNIHFGRITGTFLVDEVNDLLQRSVGLCGPELFMNHILQCLQSVSFPLSHITQENYNF